MELYIIMNRAGRRFNLTQCRPTELLCWRSHSELEVQGRHKETRLKMLRYCSSIVTAPPAAVTSSSPCPLVSLKPLARHFPRHIRTYLPNPRTLLTMAIEPVLHHNPNHQPTAHHRQHHHGEPTRDMVGLSVRPHLTQQQLDEEKASAKKKLTLKKKLQRDSLARRNTLLVGKEGSRRRNRWNNSKHGDCWLDALVGLSVVDNFVDHPHAVLRSEDLPAPGYHLDAPKFHWSYDTALAHLAVSDLDQILHADSRTHVPRHPSQSEPHVRIRRSVRQELKRSHVPEGTVRRFEAELVEFLERYGDEEAGWVVVEGCEDKSVSEGSDVFVVKEKGGEERSAEEGALYLVWEIVSVSVRRCFGSSFRVCFIRLMNCFVSPIRSTSGKTTEEGRRLTYVSHPRHRSQMSDSEDSDVDVVSSTSVGFPPRLPERSFFDYLFL
ncbi:hypothetical protein BC936DRAFT_137883 [Jimgerdemannia flammicorona]|uniref:R3H-associated N-terminal domain-containing protein n=1 Tax=Jimgerdemannia flammicorona TaxID=994334 RepID=A0A433CWH0_9FUNG|nr:hypothetical protein BC936DRAFT_137883 [Jimgerdemannia flammicorona]